MALNNGEMMPFLYEARCNRRFLGVEIRMWFKDDGFTTQAYEDMADTLLEYYCDTCQQMAARFAATALMSTNAALSALEIIVNGKSGCVLYRDWP